MGVMDHAVDHGREVSGDLYQERALRKLGRAQMDLEIGRAHV